MVSRKNFSSPSNAQDEGSSLSLHIASSSFLKDFKHEEFMGSQIVRIPKSLETCSDKKNDLLVLINSVIKKSLLNEGYELSFIENLLCKAQEVIFIIDKNTGEVTYYLRQDVYHEINEQPVGLAVYRIAEAPSAGLISKLTTKLMFEILQSRNKEENPDSKLVLVGRTFNPKVYEMRMNYGETFPNILQFKVKIDSYLKEQIVHLIHHKDFTEIFEHLIRDEIILLNKKPIILEQDKDGCDFVLENKNYFSFNLRKILLLANEKYAKYSIIQDIYHQIKTIYISGIPSEFYDMIKKVMQSFQEGSHDFDWCVIKNPTKASPPENVEEIKLIDIIDFFTGIVEKESFSLLFFCTKLTYKELKAKYIYMNEQAEEYTQRSNYKK